MTKACLALAALLSAPSLFGGWFADDHAHRAAIRDPGSALSIRPWDLFRFASGVPSETRAAVDAGALPWWTLPELKISFFRPLSTALHRFDHAVFGDAVALHHLHSIVWYLALVLVVAALYRRTLPLPIAGLSLLLFVLDDSHAQPVGWIANRNALVAGTLGLSSFLLHVRARREEKGAIFGPLLLAVALAAGEAALGAFAYVVAWEIAATNDAIRRRARALSLYLPVLVSYVVLYKALGYGTFGSGSYVDPTSAPASWLAALVPRLVALGGGALFNAPIDLFILGPHLVAWLVATCAVLLVGFAGIAAASRRHLDAEERQAVRFMLLGALLSALPLASTFPLPRLLLLPSVGVFGALATICAALLRARRLRPATYALLGLHTVFAALLWAPQYALFFGLRRATETIAREMELGPEGDRYVVVAVAPDPFTGMYAAMARKTLGLPPVGRAIVISLAPHDHVLRRTGERSIELETPRGEMLGSTFEQLLRDDRHPVRVGDVFHAAGARIEILAANAGRPTRIAVTFPMSLDDPSVRFLGFRDRGLRRVPVPNVGEEVSIARSNGVLELLVP